MQLDFVEQKESINRRHAKCKIEYDYDPLTVRVFIHYYLADYQRFNIKAIFDDVAIMGCFFPRHSMTKKGKYIVYHLEAKVMDQFYALTMRFTGFNAKCAMLHSWEDTIILEHEQYVIVHIGDNNCGVSRPATPDLDRVEVELELIREFAPSEDEVSRVMKEKNCSRQAAITKLTDDYTALRDKRDNEKIPPRPFIKKPCEEYVDHDLLNDDTV